MLDHKYISPMTKFLRRKLFLRACRDVSFGLSACFFCLCSFSCLFSFSAAWQDHFMIRGDRSFSARKLMRAPSQL